MRAPVPDGVRALGLTVGAAGVAFLTAQLTRTQDKHPWYEHSVAQVGIGLIVVGVLVFLVGAYMRDKDRESSDAAVPSKAEGKRIGVFMRGRSKFEIEDMTMRNQDTSFDTDDDAEIKGKRIDIE
jgi:hypothetical protein